MVHRTRDRFSSISPAEFFYRNRQMAGFGNPSQALFSTVRELVENSLDACDEIPIPPKIDVTISRVDVGVYRVTVADNGVGIPSANVPEAFGRVLYGSKYDARQRRGTFGLGVTMAVLYGQMTTNRPVQVHTQDNSSGGHRFRIFIDVERNRPVVDETSVSDRPVHGTTVSIELKANLRRSKERIIEYITLSSVGSPHAQFRLKIENDPPRIVGPWTKTLPTPSAPALPHPRAADVELLKRLVGQNGHLSLKEFLISSFQQVGTRMASRVLRFGNLDPKRTAQSLSRDEIVHLSNTLRNFEGFARPDSSSLSPIGKEPFLNALRSLFSPRQHVYAIRAPSEWSGNPFIIEGALVVLDDLDKTDTPELVRLANRVPLLYDAGSDSFVNLVKQISWSRYGLTDLGTPVLILHLCSTRIPYRAAGKQAIAQVPEIEAEALALLRELGRKMGRHTRKFRQTSKESRRKREFEKMLLTIWISLAPNE